MSVSHLVKATQNGPMLRLIGAVDVEGDGTEHGLASIGVFVLLDDVTVAEKGIPAFGFHPHAGASILSIPIDGGPWSSEVRGDDAAVLFGPGQVAIAHTGTGLVHDEFTASDEESSFIQLAMANFYNDEVRFELVEQTVIVEDSLWLLYDSQEPKAKVWLGSLDEASIRVHDGLHPTSWLYARPGSELSINGTAVPAASIAILESNLGEVHIHGRGSFLLGTSEEPAAPPEKILFAKGFSIARTVEDARAVKGRWDANPW